MTSFLDCETAEIDAVRGACGEDGLNIWFDECEIKARFKKARMSHQGLRCCYCQKFNQSTNNGEWDLEHVLCELHYPQFFATCGNLALACKRCNGAKGQKDMLVPQPRPDPPIDQVPDDPDRYAIPHPRLTDWHHHLTHVNHQLYAGNTPQGLNLLDVCELNRPAIEEAGLNRETVVAAVRARFFETIGSVVDKNIPDEILLPQIARLAEGNEDARAEMAMIPLSRTLNKLAKRATKRDPRHAVQEARDMLEAKAKAQVRRAPGRSIIRPMISVNPLLEPPES